MRSKYKAVSINYFRGFVLIAWLLLAFGASAQQKTVTYYDDPGKFPPDLPVRLTHLTAHVSFDPFRNLVKGVASFEFVPNRPGQDSMIFHTPDFTIKSVTINDQAVPFNQRKNQLAIPAVWKTTSGYPQPGSRVTITYSAMPLAGHIYFIGWRPEEKGKRRQIWAHRPHGWIPYMDARITVDMHVTFDSAFKVFSNGERVSVVKNQDGTKTWHYSLKNDHPFFSTALVIGDYDYTAGRTRRGVPLEFWYYPEMADRVGTTYRYTERMFDFLESEIGYNYPYSLYRQAPVIDYMYGAMETTTSTVFGDYMLITPRSWWQRNYVNVNVHELAHQWFGNCIAHLVHKDVWLTESFATYYAKMFEKSLFGDDYWQNLRLEEMKLTFDAAARNSFPLASTMAGTQRIYQKGSLVLEMLRNLMGEEQFRQAIRLYLERYAFGYAETNDFFRCTYDVSGKSYSWFFDQWVLRGGEPDYLVRDSLATDKDGNQQTIFVVRQQQEVNELNGLFRMPVWFWVCYKDGTKDTLLEWIDKSETLVVMPNPGKKEIDHLLFDPGRAVLKKVTFDQPFNRLMAQASRAENMIDRYDAWVSLRKVPLEEKKSAMKSSFSQESFHLIKSEILTQLETDTSGFANEIFREALHSGDAPVRRTALQVMHRVPESLRSDVEALLYDSSFVNVELALEDLCFSFPQDVKKYLEQTQDMTGWRGLNIRMKWLMIAIVSGDTGYLNELKGYSGQQYEFETRINAFNLMKKLKYSDQESMRNAEQAAAHWNVKLSTAAKDYLKMFKGDS